MDEETNVERVREIRACCTTWWQITALDLILSQPTSCIYFWRFRPSLTFQLLCSDEFTDSIYIYIYIYIYILIRSGVWPFEGASEDSGTDSWLKILFRQSSNCLHWYVTVFDSLKFLGQYSGIVCHTVKTKIWFSQWSLTKLLKRFSEDLLNNTCLSVCPSACDC